MLTQTIANRVTLFSLEGNKSGENIVIKYIYPDGTYCYRALHTTHAVFKNDEGSLIARAATPEGELYEFEIKGFELLEPGRIYD